MRIREVLIHAHGLTWNGNHGGQLDVGAEGWGTWRHWVDFPVIMHIAESRLVRREGRTVIGRGRSAIDDVGGIAVEGVGWGVEGIEEVVGLTRLGGVENWSFETGWETGQPSVLVEGVEEGAPYHFDVARIKAA